MTHYSQQPVTFIIEFNDDVAQIFRDTLKKNIKEIYDKFKFPKDDNDHARQNGL